MFYLFRTLKVFMVCCSSLLASSACASISSLKFGVISDLHYLSPKLMEEGNVLSNQQQALGRNLSDFEAVLNETFNVLEKEQIDVLLVPGDLTLNGEKQSHLDLSEKFKQLQSKGIQVFVIPGNHDINVPRPLGFKSSQSYPTENISPFDFESIYATCGYNTAISRDNASLSYAASLDDNTWLIAIDSNRYQEYRERSITAGRILPETEQWILKMLDLAKEQNKKVIGMMHHGIVEHIVFQDVLFPQYLVNDWNRLANLFADNGMKFIFTGHFHSNDITLLKSDAGNSIYDIETGSLQTYPYPYRIIQLSENKLSIRTGHIENIPGNVRFFNQGEELLRNWIARLLEEKIKEKIPEDFPTSVYEELIKVGTELAVLHIKGDEVIDDSLQKKLQTILSEIDIPMDFSPESLQLDYPPADNVDVVLDL